jgi:hypothetical protein
MGIKEELIEHEVDAGIAQTLPKFPNALTVRVIFVAIAKKNFGHSVKKRVQILDRRRADIRRWQASHHSGFRSRRVNPECSPLSLTLAK